ncbi:hypothetical protein [Virgisporangium aliadipatigenens]|uniref:hypothetical protein n=1 Tax=Virgisporangium aliadipatigenens TaxID=741659 RepID=UPI001943FFAB|nr:hypothetical protein [Virgisporangium aliadipatigenens]
MGTLVTLDLPDDAPALNLPWIITFGPLDDDEVWEPVVCGPYERAHALALAEAVVADEDLMAVVEPLQPAVTVDQIKGEIAANRLAADEAEDDLTEDDDHDHDHEDDSVPPSEPPTPEELREGFARIGAKLAEGLSA